MADGTVGLIANGFLPTRGSWMLDFVSVAMLAVAVVLCFSIFQVRYRKNHALHRTIQMFTAIVLALALIAFEIDVRWYTNWRELAEPSPYFESGMVHWALWIHLAFAIPTPFAWLAVILLAVTRFKEDYEAGDFNRIHRVTGRIAAALMLATAVSGWTFYYLAFVASESFR